MTTAVDNTSTKSKNVRNKLFLTTSDLMTTMNKALEDLGGSEQQDNSIIRPHVELQRRMPDGSTRPASEKDLETADMESKLRQAGSEVADLTTKQKIEWAKFQRIEGNRLYQDGDYKEAIDVYLTCLVSKSDDDEFLQQVFLPVMNNLAQASIQLGMYRKAELFCTMALKEVSEDGELVAKLYFRRGRAQRLCGKYTEARNDLKTAANMLEAHYSTAEYQSVQRELQLVQRAQVEARRNQKRQELAMKRLLGDKDQTTFEHSEYMSDLKQDVKMASTLSTSSLYQGIGNTRTHSKLTAKEERDDGTGAYQELSYWQRYLLTIARVAKKLLELVGDDEDVGCDKKRH